ncbi:MAG: hypothetical protein H7Z71_09540 [Moraxellaceae bacterium]|nr:hypothetical protein [Pseudobdellovibrionaceae bacterium]
MKNTKDKKNQSSSGKMSDTLKDISKDFLSTALGQVNKTKEDISAKVTSEIISLIRKIDFIKEFSKFAEDHKFKISAEVEIIKKNK